MKRCAELTAVLLLVAGSASAQVRTPSQGSAAIGGDVGVFLPAGNGLDSALALEGFYEHYMTARTSLRAGLGWTSPNFGPHDSLRHIRIAIDLNYNWEGGTIHPFVGAGLGLYVLQFRRNGRTIGDSELNPGGTLFGGFELFTSDTVAVKGELRYHFISDFDGVNPDGASITIGLKKYF